jgi:tripartite-type tricarboxylate transporter receptor subunit TctC
MARYSSRVWLLRILTVACGWMAVTHSAMTAEPDGRAAERNYFAGKRLTYLVSSSPGGGYDNYARLIARFLPRHLGVRSVIVKNVPGASHLLGLSKLVNAPPDGLTIATFNTGLLMAPNPLSIDLRRLSWLGKAASEPRVFVVANGEDPIGLNDLRRPGQNPALYATSGLLSASHLQMKRIGEAFGFNIRPIHGFSGSETQMVVIRGDIAGGLMSLSRVDAAIRAKTLRPLFYVGYPKPSFAVRALGEFANTPQQRRIIEEIETLSELGRMTAAPPGLPPNRLAVLRQAYIDTLTDPELLREAGRLNLPIDAWDGAQVAARVARLPALTDDSNDAYPEPTESRKH